VATSNHRLTDVGEARNVRDDAAPVDFMSRAAIELGWLVGTKHLAFAELPDEVARACERLAACDFDVCDVRTVLPWVLNVLAPHDARIRNAVEYLMDLRLEERVRQVDAMATSVAPLLCQVGRVLSRVTAGSLCDLITANELRGRAAPMDDGGYLPLDSEDERVVAQTVMQSPDEDVRFGVTMPERYLPAGAVADPERAVVDLAAWLHSEVTP
jgi:hypothetical protein